MFLSNVVKFRSVRQTYLGSSQDEELILVDPDKPVPEKGYILQLPYEILEHILNFAVQQDVDTLKKLVMVCHRFSWFALPLIYRTITIQLDPGTKSLRRLHAALQRNTCTHVFFRDHCQKLNIRIADIWPLPSGHFSILEDIISQLPKLQSLAFSGGFDRNPQETWAMIRLAFQNIPNVRSLALSRLRGGLYLPDIWDHVDFASLESLHLSGVYQPIYGRECVLDPKKHRTATFTSLTISDYEESPEATEQLLRWPKSLVNFHLQSLYNNRFTMDLPMFSTWLSIHRDTLRSIHIGSLSPMGRSDLFNAADFPNLEVLSLSRWQFLGLELQSGREMTFSEADADLLLGPNLHTFGLDFSVHDQHSENFEDFGDPEENWIRGLARAAIARKAKLRKIGITFTPLTWWLRKEHGYPWDRMDKVHAEIWPHGLRVEYNEPVLTRDEWLKIFDPSPSPTMDIESSVSENEDSGFTSEERDIRDFLIVRHP
ncbi:hypothetical protein BGW36DRAFT_369380 [Talaromyces proteolyticus]|uniref:F-box domain-containing protein n=1 Tax=Talaromyces proteolyticus TaxID=1131652 RepID=A0AAD4Q4X4_9EURO|nr:uncharacterized protein BGW36DRAFT_369380 [Talaromyces proteolyticus]KAH8703460.1 hypothetical protein BGW36DRAFT_369380 [Talaromyces proteolyticus]